MGNLFDFQLRFAELLTRADARAIYRASSPRRDTPGSLLKNDKFAIAIENVQWDRVEQFAELLVVNRLAKAIDGLPWTMKALRPQNWALALDFNEKFPPRFSKVFREALLFCNYLLNSASKQFRFDDWILDLAVYEGASLEVRFQEYIQAEDRLEVNSGLRSISASDGGVLVESARLVRTAHDVCAIGELLEEDDGNTIHCPVQATRPSSYIFWRKSDGSFASRELNPTMMMLVELAAACENVENLSRHAQTIFLGRGIKEVDLLRAIEMLEIEEIILRSR